ncbi:MAG: hypothetical protein HZA47_04890 [Planctomycetes bacterium]|uniref:hypothetical protein n=1 Tax=Candidatus Wunengus sp. YC65 TaxID=3367701 RepID=UPI001D9DE1B3|nr:hypothetical protein [Planctomycetota bacterium]
MIEEEKNEFKEKAFEIVKEIKRTDNIFLQKNAKLKGKLIAELESIVTIDIQEKVKKTLTRPILFVGDVYKSMLAGCYAHCVRKVEFTLTLPPKRLDELSIKHSGNPVKNFEMVRQMSKDLSEIEGEFIFKDCFGQPIEKLWYGDDPAYCHASVLNSNWNTYTQNTGIKNWIELYRLGKTLFLVCLEGKDSNECKEFVKNIRDMNYPKPGIPNKLIVHTNDINKLPDYFPGTFEVIELEPEKQDTPVSTLQEVISFPTPPGTQWHEVKISFTDNENVSISVRGGRSERKNYAEMGFKDKKTCKPVKSWNTLLYFSEKECLKYSQDIKSKTEKAIQDLRKRLKAYFRIVGDPIVLEHGYKPVFKVCKSENDSRSVHAYSNGNVLNEKEDD